MRRTFVVLTLGAAIMVMMAGAALAATLKGTAGPDRLIGTAGEDYITGARGDDYLHGRAGKDRIVGGSGVDEARGGAGDDRINGGSGNDKTYGEAGDDSIRGGKDRDLLSGGDGSDAIRGGDGVDRIRGGRGDDYISSVNDDSRDYVSCGPGNDTVEKIPGVGPFDAFADDCEKVKSVALKLDVEKVSSDIWGLKRQQIIVASSAAALSEAINQKVPDSGKGTYVAAFWGDKPSCGYSVTIKSADRIRDRVTTSLALKSPPPGASVCAAFTQPYAIAVMRDLDPRGLKFSFEDQRGRKLEWPAVRRVFG